MNKYVLSFAFASHLFLFGHVMATDHFAKMKTKIETRAHELADKMKNLNAHSQLMLLNLFALQADLLVDQSPEKVNALMKCIEAAQKEKDLIALFAELNEVIEDIVKGYIENIQKKIALKGNISKEEEENISKQLEAKLQELVAYITAIYYQTFYNSAAKTNKKLVYMFDENGIIPQEKRTKALPSAL